SGLGGFTARELQYIVDDGADALGVVANDVGQPALVGSDTGALGEQLTGMAHGADWVTDFMCNAGGQPTERGEFALLHALGHETGVFEEYQGGTGRIAV